MDLSNPITLNQFWWILFVIGTVGGIVNIIINKKGVFSLPFSYKDEGKWQFSLGFIGEIVASWGAAFVCSVSLVPKAPASQIMLFILLGSVAGSSLLTVMVDKFVQAIQQEAVPFFESLNHAVEDTTKTKTLKFAPGSKSSEQVDVVFTSDEKLLYDKYLLKLKDADSFIEIKFCKQKLNELILKGKQRAFT